MGIKPTVIIQLTHTEDQIFWVNSAPGVWMIRLDDLNYTDYENWLFVGAIAESYTSVTSVIFDNAFLNQVTTEIGCNAAFLSFYVSIDELYIHSPNNLYPGNHEVKIGTGAQYRKGGSLYIDGIEIEERLASVPSLSKDIGDIFESKLIYSGGNPELNNADGELDNLLDTGQIIGNKAKIYKIENSIWEKLFSGFVTGGSNGLDRISFNLKNDIESLLNIDLPPNFFTITDYPFITDKFKGKPIPLLFGYIRNLEVICTNDNAVLPATYNFVVADIAIAQIHDITAVYVDGISVAFVKSLATNSFTILTAVYDPGQSVTADIEGFQDDAGDMILKATDIIKFLFNTFLYFTDSSDFYRVWSTINIYNIYLVINSVRTLREIVEEACRSSFISLIYEDTGAFSAIANFRGDYYLSELLFWDLISFDLIDYDISKILTSANIKYNKDYKNGTFYEYYNQERKEELKTLYNQYNNKDIELNLTTELDAYNASNQIIDYFSLPWKTCIVKMPLANISELYLGFNYKINFQRPKAPNLGDYIVKILKVEKDLNTFSARLTLLLIKRLYPLIEGGSPIYDDCLYDDCVYGGIDYEEVLP
jgi:hypothetical protein